MEAKSKTFYGNPTQIAEMLSERVDFLQKKVKELEKENLKLRQKAEAYKIELDCLNN